MSKEELPFLSTVGFNKLVSLGVKPEVLIAARLQEQNYQPLYSRLYQAINFSATPLLISDPWQLQALIGHTDYYEAFSTEVTDNWGAPFSLYAAWSGNPAALDWVKTHVPHLLEANDSNGLTITYYAALSGNPAALDWVKTHVPHLLEVNNSNGLTIAHYAAWSGNPAALDWVKTHVPHLLEAKDSNGLTIAHYAAQSGNPAALDWVKTHVPHLLEAKDSNGLTIAHYAAQSGNPVCFNQALHYSATPIKLCLNHNYVNLKTMLNCINQALQTNFTLRNIQFTAQISSDESKLVQEIGQKLLRNQAIPTTMSEFTTFMLCEYRTRLQTMPEKGIQLPREVLRVILEKCLPATIPAYKVNQLLDRARKLADEAINKSLLINQTIKKTNAEITRLQINNPIIRLFVALGILKSADDKINSLTTLKQSLDDLNNVSIHNSEPIEEQVKTIANNWLQQNKAIMEKQRNQLHTFFNPQHKTKSSVFAEELITMQLN